MKNGTAISWGVSVTDDRFPPDPNCVRGEITASGYIIRDVGDFRLVSFVSSALSTIATSSCTIIPTADILLTHHSPNSENLCEVTYIVTADPKGYVPSWIINLVASDQAMNVARIRRYFRRKGKETQVGHFHLILHLTYHHLSSPCTSSRSRFQPQPPQTWSQTLRGWN